MRAIVAHDAQGRADEQRAIGVERQVAHVAVRQGLLLDHHLHLPVAVTGDAVVGTDPHCVAVGQQCQHAVRGQPVVFGEFHGFGAIRVEDHNPLAIIAEPGAPLRIHRDAVVGAQPLEGSPLAVAVTAGVAVGDGRPDRPIGSHGQGGSPAARAADAIRAGEGVPGLVGISRIEALDPAIGAYPEHSIRCGGESIHEVCRRQVALHAEGGFLPCDQGVQAGVVDEERCAVVIQRHSKHAFGIAEELRTGAGGRIEAAQVAPANGRCADPERAIVGEGHLADVGQAGDLAAGVEFPLVVPELRQSAGGAHPEAAIGAHGKRVGPLIRQAVGFIIHRHLGPADFGDAVVAGGDPDVFPDDGNIADAVPGEALLVGVARPRAGLQVEHTQPGVADEQAVVCRVTVEAIYLAHSQAHFLWCDGRRIPVAGHGIVEAEAQLRAHDDARLPSTAGDRHIADRQRVGAHVAQAIERGVHFGKSFLQGGGDFPEHHAAQCGCVDYAIIDYHIPRGVGIGVGIPARIEPRDRLWRYRGKEFHRSEYRLEKRLDLRPALGGCAAQHQEALCGGGHQHRDASLRPCAALFGAHAGDVAHVQFRRGASFDVIFIGEHLQELFGSDALPELATQQHQPWPAHISVGCEHHRRVFIMFQIVAGQSAEAEAAVFVAFDCTEFDLWRRCGCGNCLRWGLCRCDGRRLWRGRFFGAPA